MWTLIITLASHVGVSCTPVYGFLTKEDAEAAQRAHDDSFGGSTPVYYTIVKMGDTA